MTGLPYITESMVEAGYRKLMASYNGDVLRMKVLELERLGGACLQCDKPYERVVVKNHSADFAWYRPACKCWSRCGRTRTRKGDGTVTGEAVDEHGTSVGCGRHLVVENMMHRFDCDVCNPPIVQYKDDKPKYVGKRKRQDEGRDDG